MRFIDDKQMHFKEDYIDDFFYSSSLIIRNNKKKINKLEKKICSLENEITDIKRKLKKRSLESKDVIF